MMTSDEIWEQNFKQFLTKNLSPILPDKHTLDKFMTPDVLRIWRKAFTHPSIDFRNNYEELEFWGDRVLKCIFSKYTTTKYPFLKKSHLTSLDISYMSKLEQSRISERIGIPPLIFVLPELDSRDVHEDVFESFIGALSTIGDMLNPSDIMYGEKISYAFLTDYFNKHPIDLERRFGNAVTLVNQIFSRFTARFKDIKAPYVKQEKIAKGMVETQVLLNQEHFDFIRRYSDNPNINTNKLIGYGVGSSTDVSRDLAYEDALKNLKERYGLTSQLSRAMKNREDFYSDNLQPYIDELDDKLEREGYVDKRFLTQKKSVDETSVIVSLVGMKDAEGFEEDILANVRVEHGGQLSARLDAVKQYLARK